MPLGDLAVAFHHLEMGKPVSLSGRRQLALYFNEGNLDDENRELRENHLRHVYGWQKDDRLQRIADFRSHGRVAEYFYAVHGGHDVREEARWLIAPSLTAARESSGSRPTRTRGSRRGGSRGSPSDDDGESEPAGLEHGWRHPHWGACNPAMLRFLLRGAPR